MNQLEKLQQTFQDCVINSDSKGATDWISAQGRAEPEVQVSIYSHAYRARLQEVLENDFPVLHQAIGDDHFRLLIDNYIENYPSKYYSLRNFACDFPAYIQSLLDNNKLQQDAAWLYELSLFEWSLGQAFDATDSVLFSEQDMAAIPPADWPELKFSLHPSVQRLNLEWNVVEIFLALTDDDPKPITANHESSSPWIIWRENYVTRFRSMSLDEQLAFDTLARDSNFNQVCEVLSTLIDENDVPMHAAGLLKAWISQGFIQAVSF